MRTLQQLGALIIAVPLAMIAGGIFLVAMPFLALGLLVLALARWVLE